MIRVVLDTNVLASATIVERGASARILQAWFKGEVTLITSPVLLKELHEVLERPRIKKRQWLTSAQVARLLLHLGTRATQASSALLVRGITPDPDDDYVLSAAVEQRADYIVTGDQDLLDLGEYEGILITTPAIFARLV